jgi:hypothetical protein
MKNLVSRGVAAACFVACLGVPARAQAAPPEYANAIALDNPIAHWRFNESSGLTAVDASVHGHNGAYLSDPTMFVFSRLVTPGDTGVTFANLASRVLVPNGSALNPAQITIEALLTWRGPNGFQQRIVEKSLNAAATEPLYGLNISDDGRILLQLRTTEGLTEIDTDAGVVPMNSALHLVATYNGTQARIYMNGELKLSEPVSGDLVSSSHPLIVCNRSSANRGCNATLDELAIFPSALSESRIGVHLATTVARVPITIHPPRPDKRDPGQADFGQFVSTTFPVQVGVPIPEGTLYSAAQTRIIGPNGQTQLAETKVLGRWRKFLGPGAPVPPDESIPVKWLQVSFNADVTLTASPVTYHLEYGPGVTNPALLLPSMVTSVGDDFIVNTGALQFRVNRGSPKLLDQVWVDVDGDRTFESNEIVVAPPAGNPGAAHGLYFVDQASNEWRASNDAAATLEVERNNPDPQESDPHPQQVTLKATGHYRLPGQENSDDNQWIVRIKAYAGKPFVRIYHTIVFNKSSEERRYKDIGIELRLPSASNPAVRYGAGYERPRLLRPDQPEYLDYSTTLLDQWFTPNLTGLSKFMLHQARHSLYRFFRFDSAGWHEMGAGGYKRAGHWFDVSATNGVGSFGVTAALRAMWQNYPNALEWEQAGSDQIVRMHLWTRRATPAETEPSTRLLDFRPVQYLRSRGKYPASEGGVGALPIFQEQIVSSSCPNRRYEYPNAPEFSSGSCPTGCMHATAVGVSKTHELTFEFHRNALTPGPSSPPETAFLLQKPVIAHVDPKWLRDSLALGPIHPKDEANFPQIDGTAPDMNGDCPPGRKQKPDGTCQSFLDMYMDRYLLEQVVDGNDRPPPFGPTYPLDVPPGFENTRDWGDSYGAFDFGDTLLSGKGAHRYFTHNKYFIPSNFWLWFARSGDRRAYEFGEYNSRHVMDIDTVHTQYDFNYGACGPEQVNQGPKRMFRGTPRTGDMGAIHWSASRPNDFGCALLLPPNNTTCDPSVVDVPVFTQPADYASYLTKYYYLTGYERARDVALEIATYIAQVAQRPHEEYWTQADSRSLGGGLQAASELYELSGEPWLQTAASKVALELIGQGDGQELASNWICPSPSPGIGLGFGTPLDSSWTYMAPGMITYRRIATETSVPSAEQASQWLRNQVGALAAGNLHRWPNTDANHWPAMAAAFYEETDPAAKAAALRVGLDEFNRAQASGWDDFPQPYVRGFTLYGLPYLMDALATASASEIQIVAQPEALSSAAELQLDKSGSAPVPVTLRAQATPHAGLGLYSETSLFQHPAGSLPAPVLPAGANASDGGPRVCWLQNGCSAAIVVYDPNGIEIARKPYRAGFESQSPPPGCTASIGNLTSRSRTWYNEGGWVETVDLVGPSGIYRARVEVDGLVTADTVVQNGVPTIEYNKPLYQLFLVRNDPAEAKVMAFAGNNDGLSPGFRYANERPLRFYMPPPVFAGPVQFTFDLVTSTSYTRYFPFAVKAVGASVGPSVSGGGDGVPYVISVPSAQRDAPWVVDLGPEMWKFNFGYDHAIDCLTTPNEEGCKSLQKWPAETRPFRSSGVYPFYADSADNYFKPVPLWTPVLLSPNQMTDVLPPPPAFTWRAVAGAQRYRFGWKDGAYCAAHNYEVVTAEQAHCAYGVGKCWVQRPIVRGPGRWTVQAQRNEVPEQEWLWSPDTWFRHGPILLHPTALATEPGPVFKWIPLAGATHYEVQVDDASSVPLKRRTYTAAEAECAPAVPPNPQPTECRVTFTDALAPGPATWKVHANCSQKFSAAQPFVVN